LDDFHHSFRIAGSPTARLVSPKEERRRMADIQTPAQSGAAPVTGLALIACAFASVGLLMIHPGGAPSHELADVLRAEAAQAGSDAVVHGGFVVVLAIELVGFLALAMRVGARRTAVLAALVFAVGGAGLLSASMVADGLVTPAVAARYAVAPAEKQEAARALLVLLGAAINALMPMGLAFLGAAALTWGAALTPIRGRARAAGIVALASGAIVLAAIGLGLASPNPASLMIALLASAAWPLAAGALLATWRAD
jgi:hypothetical protein